MNRAHFVSLRRRRPYFLVNAKYRVAFWERLVQVVGAKNIFFDGRCRVHRLATLDASSGSIRLGDRAVICRGAVLESAGGEICIGARSVVGDFSSLYGQGGLRIGSDVLMASGVRIIPSTHTYDDASRPIAAQPIEGRPINIGDGVWIGTNAVILGGASIGVGAIIGAGSVVVRDVSANAIVAGVPARLLRIRA